MTPREASTALTLLSLVVLLMGWLAMIVTAHLLWGSP